MTDNRCSPDSDQALVVLVDRFAKRLLAKLRLAHANGRSGWEKDDWEQQCQDGLLRHLEKGDPRDVAAYCAFMDHHGWITRSPDVAAAPVMQAAQNAAKVVDGWSDSKREYADRVTGAAQATADPFMEDYKRDTIAGLIEQCAMIAEGPLYKEHYRGRAGHNWWHQKQRSSDAQYGNGRHDAAAEIRALALSSTNAGCGDPTCKDPNCDYGRGPNTDPLSSTDCK